MPCVHFPFIFFWISGPVGSYGPSMRSVSFVLIVLFLVVLDPLVVQSGCGTMRWEEDSFGLRTTASMIKYLNELHAPCCIWVAFMCTYTYMYLQMRLRASSQNPLDIRSQNAEAGKTQARTRCVSPDFERPINSTRDRRTEEHDEGG